MVEPWYWEFLPQPQLCSYLGSHPSPWVWDDITFTLGNGSDLEGRDWWFIIKSSLFCSTTKTHDINSKYFVNLHSRYYYCSSTFEAWNVVKVFSNMFSSMIYSPHSLNWELILNNVKLYSLIVLKYCNLKCI